MKILSIIISNSLLTLFFPFTLLLHNLASPANNNYSNSIENLEFVNDTIVYTTKKSSQLSSSLRMNSTGKLLWKGTAETGDFSEWSNGGNYKQNPHRVLFSGATRERANSGSYSFKYTVDAGIDKASTQVFRYGVKGEPNTNADAIYTVWYYIPQKIDFYGASWHNMMQWMVVAPFGNQPVYAIGLGVIGGKGSGGNNYIELRNTGEWFVGGNSFNHSPLVEIPTPVNQWFKIKVRYIHGRNNDGRVMVWQGDSSGNETLIYDVKDVTTFPSFKKGWIATKEMTWSVNNYTARTKPAITTIYFDDASIHLPGNTNNNEESYSIEFKSSPEEGGKVKINQN